MTTHQTVFALAIVGVSLCACDGPRGVIENASLIAPTNAPGTGYRVVPGDKVKVTVFNEPEFSGEYQVNDMGNIAFPLIGEVPANGSSVAQIREQLIRRLRGGYVRDPRVSVEVSVYRPISVFGEVKTAGQFAFRPGLTVQDAIAMAGGFTYRANSHTAYIRRADAKGEQTVQIDTERPAVMPGDSVRVPERFF